MVLQLLKGDRQKGDFQEGQDNRGVELIANNQSAEVFKPNR
jgi:hypothetical protein